MIFSIFFIKRLLFHVISPIWEIKKNLGLLRCAKFHEDLFAYHHVSEIFNSWKTNFNSTFYNDVAQTDGTEMFRVLIYETKKLTINQNLSFMDILSKLAYFYHILFSIFFFRFFKTKNNIFSCHPTGTQKCNIFRAFRKRRNEGYFWFLSSFFPMPYFLSEKMYLLEQTTYLRIRWLH